ncbi:hypothetical protein [Nesterenkonia halotolerans]|uniref:Uncharacterized protein n=1 Tax=Nesterenkonia halotolerans TaxID=225325 RepID=A0ABR9J5Y9_9MICC|nr:hypothetical protein [Nesterenkonia halotolerans]MBE1514410.1 hypothetical protein [Nesterenkonia halotolerans]
MDMALLHTLNGFGLAALMIVTIFLSTKAFTTLTPTTAAQQAEGTPEFSAVPAGAHAP